METTRPDPVIAEVRAVRDGFAKRADYDVGAIFLRIREMQDESGREYELSRAPDRRGVRRVAGRLGGATRRAVAFNPARRCSRPTAA